jgi:hypothetical protein
MIQFLDRAQLQNPSGQTTDSGKQASERFSLFLLCRSFFHNDPTTPDKFGCSFSAPITKALSASWGTIGAKTPPPPDDKAAISESRSRSALPYRAVITFTMEQTKALNALEVRTAPPRSSSVVKLQI